LSTVAIGTIAAGAIAAGASAYGASKQAGAAEQGQNLQAQEAQNALNFQEQEWNQQQANEAPWLKAGGGALKTLSSQLSTPGQGLLSAYPGGTFQSPTLAQAEQQPGYQFALQQGEGALQNSAAAKGNLLSGNTLEAQQQYGQGLAETNYNNVYQQALQNYNTNFNVWNQDQSNVYNRLAGVAGAGQTAVGQLGQEGQAASQNTGNIMLTTGAQQSQEMNNAAAAMASGYTGAGNAIGGSIGNLTQLAMLQQILGGSGGSTGSTGIPSDQYAATAFPS
jgi:hypothetical protein